MKRIFILLTAISTILLLSSCDQLFGPKEGPNDLGGSTDVDYAKVGEKFTGSLKINDSYKDLDNSFHIKSLLIALIENKRFIQGPRQ
jgi:hypothetical protein